MYEELGSVREPIGLSPSEVLSSAEELLRRQGYRIIYRTDVMVVGKREDPNSLVSREPVHLAVFARPHPAGGLSVTLQGDDREGVRERAGEWSRWADGLPKGARKERERERPAGTPPGARTAEVRPKQPEAKEPPATTKIGQPPTSPEQRKRSYAPRPPSSEPRSAPPSGDSEVKEKAPGRAVGAWTSIGPWERKVRTAPGKVENGLDE
jgi:hypothetical protein